MKKDLFDLDIRIENISATAMYYPLTQEDCDKTYTCRRFSQARTCWISDCICPE